MNLKNRLGDVETDCRDRLHDLLLRIVRALTAPTSLALSCRWRSRPQHHQETHALQHGMQDARPSLSLVHDLSGLKKKDRLAAIVLKSDQCFNQAASGAAFRFPI